jgi:hypothetical protein
METLILNWTTTATKQLAKSAKIAVLSTMLATGIAATCLAQSSAPKQKKFETPQLATHALFIAVQNGDKPAIMAILGAPRSLISTENQDQYKEERTRFVLKYQEMRRLVREPDGTTVLYIGAENWQFPFPLIGSKGSWHFDSEAGIREVVFRRIGENETAIIETCKSLVQPDASGQSISATGVKLSHGYYIRKLTAGTVATGKAIASTGITNSKFVYVAYPVEYRSSGVMTFMVNTDGVVYARDLGPDSTIANEKKKTVDRPDSTWAIEK